MLKPQAGLQLWPAFEKGKPPFRRIAAWSLPERNPQLIQRQEWRLPGGLPEILEVASWQGLSANPCIEQEQASADQNHRVAFITS
jgi:hypothetical protein